MTTARCTSLFLALIACLATLLTGCYGSAVTSDVDVTSDASVVAGSGASGPAAMVDDDDDEGGEDGDDDGEEHEEDIALDDIPAAVMEAALARLPGLVVDEAEIEHTSAGPIYDLEGTIDGVAWEIEITPSGEVIEVEQDDD